MDYITEFVICVCEFVNKLWVNDRDDWVYFSFFFRAICRFSMSADSSELIKCSWLNVFLELHVRYSFDPCALHHVYDAWSVSPLGNGRQRFFWVSSKWFVISIAEMVHYTRSTEEINHQNTDLKTWMHLIKSGFKSDILFAWEITWSKSRRFPKLKMKNDPNRRAISKRQMIHKKRFRVMNSRTGLCN